MKIIENKCTGATLIEWQKLQDLQPQNLKVPYHTEKIKKSIIELGFANPFDVWINPKTNEMLIADGHGRKDVLLELIADGFQVPNELPCTFLDNTKITTEQEAIKYLLRVFNVKRNSMDSETLENWIEEFDLSVDDVAFDGLDIKFEVENLETEEGNDKNKEVEEISGVFDDHLSGTKGFHKLTLLFNEDQYSLVTEVLKNEKVSNITEWFYNIVNEKYYN